MIPRRLAGIEREKAIQRRDELSRIQKKVLALLFTIRSKLEGGYVKSNGVPYTAIQNSTLSFFYVRISRGESLEQKKLKEIAEVIIETLSQCPEISRITISKILAFKCSIGNRKNNKIVVVREDEGPYIMPVRSLPGVYRNALAKLQSTESAPKPTPVIDYKKLMEESKKKTEVVMTFDEKVEFRNNAIGDVVARGYGSGYRVSQITHDPQKVFSITRVDMEVNIFERMKALLGERYNVRYGLNVDTIVVQFLPKKES